jgi:hypothetical protein
LPIKAAIAGARFSQKQSSNQLASAAIGGGASVSSIQYNKQQDGRKMKILLNHEKIKLLKQNRNLYENKYKEKR